MTWAKGDAKAVAALLQLSLTLSRAGDHAHPVQYRECIIPLHGMNNIQLINQLPWMQRYVLLELRGLSPQLSLYHGQQLLPRDLAGPVVRLAPRSL